MTPRLIRTLTVLVLACAPWVLPDRATAQQPQSAVPACTGRDLYEVMAREEPAERARIDAAAEDVKNGKAVFWRVEKTGTTPSYLFGTVHLTDDRVNALPPAIAAALGSSSRIALEVEDLSPAVAGKAIGNVSDLLVYRDGRSLLTELSKDEASQAQRAIAKMGMPVEALRAIRPWVVTMTLALSDCERRRGASGLQPLDMRLAHAGKSRGIPVIGLETIEDQMRAMARVPENDQLTVLKASIKLYDLTDDMVETMVQLYLSRKIGVIWPLQERLWQQAGYPVEAFQSFQRELVSRRNFAMRDAALPLLQAGGVFIGVGALHLSGADGLVQLLQDAGFTVTPAE